MLNLDAPWWNAANPQDGMPIVRHAPDNENYHYPDGRMLERIRSGIGQPVLIPKAKRDGSSPGFDARVPGVVHVDPDAPDGGVVVDLQQVSAESMNKALAVSSYPHQVFYRLGVNPRELDSDNEPSRTRESERAAPVGAGYVVAKAGRDGAPEGYGASVPQVTSGQQAAINRPLLYQIQEEQAVNPTPPLSSLPPIAPANPQVQSGPAAVPAAQAAPTHYYQPAPPLGYPQPAPPSYPQQVGMPQYVPQPVYPPQPLHDPVMMQMMQNMAATMQSLHKLAEARQVESKPVAPPTGVRPGRLITAPLNSHGQQRTTSRKANSIFAQDDVRPIPNRPPQRTQDDGYDDDEMLQGDLADNINGYEDDGDEHTDGPVKRNGRTSLVQERNQAASTRKRQTLKDVERTQTKDDGVIYGFETLGIEYVTGPLPQKAKRQVFFEFPKIGKSSSRFHEVIDGKNSVTLVYDTRYEEGTQYLPPDLSDTVIKLTVPHLKKEFTVTSMDIVYSHGVFDHIVLIKVPDDPVASSDFFEGEE